MNTVDWTVIGAGPAGIAAVGKLLDHGVQGAHIAWIDPHFSVGDFGTLWKNVPSNTMVDLFLKFLHASDAFEYSTCSERFLLHEIALDKTCYLKYIAEPLQWVTNQLKNKVTAMNDMVEHLVLRGRQWHIKLKNTNLCSRNVILATGSLPIELSYPGLSVIPLQDALDPDRIKNHCDSTDTVAVFGSSHSAVLALRNLVLSSAKQIVNFYREPLLYAVYLDDWILFDDTGLKGSTAEWAREHLDGMLPSNLKRVYSNETNIQRYLLQCNKVIYAVGFKRRLLPVVDGINELNPINEAGIMAPGLFGVGIAYPEKKYNRLGILEYRVGIWKFMDYLQRIMPIWLRYGP